MSNAGEPRYAGFWIRFVAQLIDGIVLSIGMAVLLVPLGIFALGVDLGAVAAGVPGPGAAIVSLLSFVIPILYYVLLTASRWQATLGKRALKIYVSPVDGGRVSPIKSILRYVGYIVSSIPLMLGFVMAAFHKQKRGLHDIIAGTVALRGRPDLAFAPAAAPAPEPEPEPAPEAAPEIDFDAADLDAHPPVEMKPAGRRIDGPTLAIAAGVLLLALAGVMHFLR